MSSDLVELAKHLPERLARYAPQFLAGELCRGVDAYVLAAICDQESRGGDALQPRGPAGTGDHGHGRGLMQIDDRWHKGFIVARYPNGRCLWTDASANIDYAARLLRSNLEEFEDEQNAAIAAYNCGCATVREGLDDLPSDHSAADRLAAIQKRTAGGNYVSRVLGIRAAFFDKPV